MKLQASFVAVMESVTLEHDHNLAVQIRAGMGKTVISLALARLIQKQGKEVIIVVVTPLL